MRNAAVLAHKVRQAQAVRLAPQEPQAPKDQLVQLVRAALAQKDPQAQQDRTDHQVRRTTPRSSILL